MNISVIVHSPFQSKEFRLADSSNKMLIIISYNNVGMACQHGCQFGLKENQCISVQATYKICYSPFISKAWSQSLFDFYCNQL